MGDTVVPNAETPWFTTMDDGHALLKSILEQPEDTVARLVYADWLEENAGYMSCGICRGSGRGKPLVRRLPHGEHRYEPRPPCHNCNGSGRTSDGAREQAEFIRVQCECDGRALHERQRLLLEEYSNLWEPNSALINPSWSRGFITKAELPAEAFVCDTCGSTARNKGGGACAACGDVGRLKGYAAELFGRHPVEKVALTGFDPGEISVCWFASVGRNVAPESVDRNWLPWSIATRLGPNFVRAHFTTFVRHTWHYPDRQTAFAALSDALVLIGREMAQTV